MNIFRQILNTQISPVNPVWKAFFFIARLSYKFEFAKPNTTIQYVARDDWFLILTPLSGSSSIRAVLNNENVRKHDLRKPFNQALPARVFVLERDYKKRLTSFYNKKVRNPTTLAKARLLASCSPLTWSTSPEEFVEWEANVRNTIVKDKHLYTHAQILSGFDLLQEDTVVLEIKRDQKFLMELLGIDLSVRVNSTDMVSNFAKPLEIPLENYP